MKTSYIIGILVIAAFALWYIFGTTKTAGVETSAVEQTQETALSSGDTTADISADLAGTLDTSAALDADAAAAAEAVQGL